MKTILLALMVLASVAMADDAPQYVVTDKVFFSGVHLGMTIEAAWAYYFPDGAVPAAVGAPALGSIPLGEGNGVPATRAIADGGSCWHSGAPDGERYLDFRHQNPTWRVLVCYRKSDSIIVSVDYWRLDGRGFSPDEIRFLIDLNHGQGTLLEPYDNGDEFFVTTVKEYKFQHPRELKAVDDKTFFRGAHLGMTIEECTAYYDPIAEASAVKPGEHYIDFNTLSDPPRFVTVCFRESDRKIVSVVYKKMGTNETFSPEEIRYLTLLNRSQGPLVTHLYSGAGFEVATPQQAEFERDKFEHP
jgi:hypothetical protein